MSVFTYNGVTIPYASTAYFTQGPAYDEVSQTDWFATRFDIQVAGVLNIAYLKIIDPTLVGKGIRNAAELMVVVRDRLMAPRKRLSFTFGGVDVIPQATVAGSVDVDNGPKPQDCRVTRLTNESFYVVYRITATYWENYDPNVFPRVNRPGNNVLFNRWTETVDIDDRGFSTRSRDGKFKVRSDNADGVVPDAVRSAMAVVGVPRGFLRTSSRYTQTPDGLGLQYSVTDREQFKMPPSPAFKASGRYTQTTTKGQAKMFGHIHLRLEGGRLTDQEALLDRAMAIAAAKLQITGAPLVGPKDKRAILQNGSLSVDLYDNVVEVDMTVMFFPTKQRRQGVPVGPGAFTQVMTFTPYTDGVQPPPMPDYGDRGSAGLLLQSAAYYDPSLRDVKLNRETGQMSAGLEPGTAGVRG